jgi:hypothetical protein
MEVDTKNPRIKENDVSSYIDKPVKVIETHISLDEYGNYKDFQSRVIEVKSWNSFIEEIKNKKVVMRFSAIGKLMGASLPRNAEISDLKYDEMHLSCLVINSMGMKFLKLAYLINE